MVVSQAKKKDIEAIYPLSPMQQGILFHTLYVPESHAFFNQFILTIEGDLDISAFERAWQQVVDRHGILRTVFVWENLKQPLQIVRKKADLPWNYYDWRSKSSIQQEEQLQTFLQDERERGFELTKAPIMRCALIQIADQTYQFVWSEHHLLLDGWCSPLILKEVLTFYQAQIQKEIIHLPIPRPYRDYIVWLQQQDIKSAEEFWREELRGFISPTSLGLDRREKNDLQQKYTYHQDSVELSATLTEALQSLAKQHRLTLSTLIYGVWAILLSRYSGEAEVVFGSIVSGRPPSLAGVESMIGMFFNTLPVRAKVSGDTPLLFWLKQLQKKHTELQQYSYSPLVEIQKWSEVCTGIPLFESVVAFQNYPIEENLLKHSSSLEVTNIRVFDQSDYPLTLIVVPHKTLLLQLDYYDNLFEVGTIRGMLEHLQTLLEEIVANPQRQIGELSLLTERERQKLLVEWNNTQTNYPQDKCIHQLFEEQVEQNPDAIALIFENQQLTYGQLNDRANQLAHYLKSLGVAPEVLVGICVERSLEMVIGLLGIIKAGGAYVPLDPGYPQERLAYMIGDSQVTLLLTQEKLITYLPPHQAQVICLDSDWGTIGSQNQENPETNVNPENLAYVIYTSGSTGKPKGVMNSHRGLVNRLLWMQDTYQLTEGDRVLQKTPFSFDVSVWEFFWPLITGVQLVVAQPGGHQDSEYLVRLIAQQQITTLHFVPSMLQIFLEEKALETCSSLRQVICSGEALPFDLQERFFERLGNCKLHNLYGPTEAAIDVTSYHCQPGTERKIVPIGRPIANTQIYILDPNLQPVPMGVQGELHIGGVQLARGYLNRPELTQEKFIPDPFSEKPGAKLYKTGDVARYLGDGNIEYLGRIDHQVKLRGFRIELGEIEAVLSQNPSVREAVVIVREDEPDNKRLVAYLVPQQEKVSLSQLRQFLLEQLPDYMVPSAFVWLEAMPLTPNGKVNRRSLPVPEGTRETEVSFVPPRTPSEKIIADLIAEVLKLEQVGIYDNFFELGGHSLLATQAISRLRGAFRIELSLRTLFEFPTVAQLAEIIENLKDSSDTKQSPAITKISRKNRRIKRSALKPGN